MTAEEWGVSTQKGKKLYIHVLDWDKEVLLVQSFKEKVQSVVFFKDKSKVKYRLDQYGLLLEIPNDKKDEVDTIIEVTLK